MQLLPAEAEVLASQLPHAVKAFARPDFSVAVLDMERGWLPAGALAVALLMVQPLDLLPEAAASLGPAAVQVPSPTLPPLVISQFLPPPPHRQHLRYAQFETVSHAWAFASNMEYVWLLATAFWGPRRQV